MEKRFVLVQTFGLIVQNVISFKTIEEAKEGFKAYTGIDYDYYLEAQYGDTPTEEFSVDWDFDETKIFEIEI